MIAGRGPSPLIVLTYAQGLPDTSLTSALASGGRDHYGWGHDRHLMANLYDALNQNTRATGQWGKGKAPKFPAYPRPKSKPAGSPKGKPVTVADIYRKFQRR